MKPVEFILNVLKDLFPDSAFGKTQRLNAIHHLAPLLNEFLLSEDVLTDELRAEILSRIHTLLRQARLMPQADFNRDLP